MPTSVITQTVIERPTWLERPLWRGLTLNQLLLLALMIGSAALHLINIQAIGDANAYYTAAVKAMLQSWSNFFFVAAEPGGSVSVDKPPLGLWIEAAFALALGINGFAVSLPNMLAGIFGVPLIYTLVKKHAGTLAGLVAAAVFATTPTVIGTDRNNTMDGMLVFCLLLTTWAFIKATEAGKLRWLLLGGLLLGLGFNIKMLQAFLPLPAFYALYFFGANNSWRQKIINLSVMTILLLSVSLSWALVVDLTPATARPYIGSSQTNSVLELMIGYNGLNRLLGMQRNPGGIDDGGNVSPIPAPGFPGADNSPFDRPPTSEMPGMPPNQAGDGPVWNNRAGGGMFEQEIGTPSPVRLFVPPLAKELSWLLPFGIVSLIALATLTRPTWPLAAGHKTALLWGGWLVIGMIFFSVANFFHDYYLIMLAAPLAAVIGSGVAVAWRERARLWMTGLVVLAATGTLIFQWWLARQYGQDAWWLWVAALVLAGGVIALAIGQWRMRKIALPLAYTLIIAALLITPLAWSVLTAINQQPGEALPGAYGGSIGATNRPPMGDRDMPAVPQAGDVTALLTFLQANTQDIDYLVAVPSAQTGAPLVLATGRPVLYMGGFSGSDPVIDAEGLQALVNAQRLRYILFAGRAPNNAITAWLQTSCKPVEEMSQGMQVLYECRP
ncbi:glycosyltransferase family 39 protein [Chloroflexus sp.]|uniref:glycosyltransferase family 39 protein n=1 Tax=Chloroflexus sp. TaxID=1904827 RepID=UPI002614BF2D|nr:glycosyltransferase family 39 protein [uncultured Chloroflexus sp.]